MAKRFTASEKWEDLWFSELSNKYKLFWIYLLDKCDNAGVWENILKSNSIHFYRHSDRFYLRNGTLHELTQSCGIKILSQLHGKTDEQAENVINELYEKGMIEDKPDSDIQQAKKWVEPNIFSMILKGKPTGKYYVRKKVDGKKFNRVFHSLEEARQFVEPMNQPDPNRNIYKRITSTGIVLYKFQKIIGKQSVSKYFKTLEEARAFRDEIKMS